VAGFPNIELPYFAYAMDHDTKPGPCLKSST